MILEDDELKQIAREEYIEQVRMYITIYKENLIYQPIDKAISRTITSLLKNDEEIQSLLKQRVIDAVDNVNSYEVFYQETSLGRKMIDAVLREEKDHLSSKIDEIIKKDLF